jgi:hypothetical protein
MRIAVVPKGGLSIGVESLRMEAELPATRAGVALPDTAPGIAGSSSLTSEETYVTARVKRDRRRANWAAMLSLAALSVALAGCGKSSAPTAAGPGAPVNVRPSPHAALVPAPPPDVSALTFSTVDMGSGEPTGGYRSSWMGYSDSVTVKRASKGLRCDIVVGSRRAGYGGVRFAVKPFKALRLDVVFDDPKVLENVYVDGYGSKGRVMRWHWYVRKSPFTPAVAGPYVLVPGKSSGYFAFSGDADASTVREVHVFVMAARGQHTGFTLQKAETAQ